MDTIAKLLDGHKTFKQDYYPAHAELFAQLATGQQPKVMLITCADSRITPDILFGTPPGELFVLRNVANIVHCYDEDKADFSTRSAIEYAVQHLAIEHIVILGHASCGGIAALMQQEQGKPTGEFISPWLECAQPAAKEILSQCQEADAAQQNYQCELASIQRSLQNLETYPWVKDKLQAQQLQLHGWHFSISTGDLYCYDESQQKFIQQV